MNAPCRMQIKKSPRSKVSGKRYKRNLLRLLARKRHRRQIRALMLVLRICAAGTPIFGHVHAPARLLALPSYISISARQYGKRTTPELREACYS